MAFQLDPISNFAYSLVVTAPSPATSGTSLTLAAGGGALFPDPGAQGYNVTVYPPETGPLLSNAEIVRVTAKVGDVLTISRAQEGTVAKSIVAGWQVAQAVTKKTMEDIEAAINTATPEGALVYVPGLDPTGSADASAVLNSAISDMDSDGGGTLYVAPGTYKIGSAVTLYPTVKVVGSGMDATIFRASANVIMFAMLSNASDGVAAYNGGIDRATIDGDSTGSTGLRLQRMYAGQSRELRVRRCAVGINFHGCCIWDLYGCHITENVKGIYGDVHDLGGGNLWGSNLIQIFGGRHDFNTGWFIDADTCGMWNLYSVNPELNGTTGDDNTGVIRWSNGNYQQSLNLYGCWFERNKGFATLAFYTPGIQDVRAIWIGGLCDYNSSNLKHGIYLGASATNRHRILTEGVSLGTHGVSDITLSDARCYWERGPTNTSGTLNTGSGVVYPWGNSTAGGGISVVPFQTLTDGATITWTMDTAAVVQNAAVTLGGNRTLAFSGAADGMQGILKVIQDGTGSRTLTLPANAYTVGGGGGSLTLTTTPGAVDLLRWTRVGANYYWEIALNFTGGAATWQTLTFENFDGVTAPAKPASISGDSGASIATSTTNPQTAPNCMVSTTTAGVADYAFFASTDGQGGSARTTADIRIEAGGSSYVSGRTMVRAQSKGADANSYLIEFSNSSGTLEIQVFKRVAGSTITLSSPFTPASGLYFRITIEAVGTAIKARCQRLSDGFWLQTNNTFASGAADFYSVNDSSLTGAGYQGVQIYRESGGAAVSIDNVRAEAFF